MSRLSAPQREHVLVEAARPFGNRCREDVRSRHRKVAAFFQPDAAKTGKPYLSFTDADALADPEAAAPRALSFESRIADATFALTGHPPQIAADRTVQIPHSRLGHALGDLVHPRPLALFALVQLPLKVEHAWVHVDLDVVDPVEMFAVNFPEPDGVSFEALAEALRVLAEVATIRGVEVCAYDPRQDPERRLVPRIAQAIAPLLN